MHIDWATLVAVAVVAAAAALIVVLLVAFALVGLSLRSAPVRPQHQRVDHPSEWGPASRTTLGRLVAGLCLLAAGLIVCYGLYLIVA